jgi:hypothetical protein
MKALACTPETELLLPVPIIVYPIAVKMTSTRCGDQGNRIRKHLIYKPRNTYNRPVLCAKRQQCPEKRSCGKQ